MDGCDLCELYGETSYVFPSTIMLQPLLLLSGHCGRCGVFCFEYPIGCCVIFASCNRDTTISGHVTVLFWIARYLFQSECGYRIGLVGR